MRRSALWTAIPLAIVMALPACDNVSWEGFDLQLEAPPERETDAEPDEPVEDEDAPPPPLDVGPLLHVVERDPNGGEASLLPVAELAPAEETLIPLPSTADPSGFAESFQFHRFEEGTEYLLLAGGRRAGTFVADGDVEVASGFCPPRFRGTGRTELVDQAHDHQRFLAISKEDAGSAEFGEIPEAIPDPQLEEASETAAGPLMMEYEAPWPPSMGGIREALRIISVPPTGERFLAATFVFGDELAVGPAGDNAYALSYLARQQNGTFETVHSRYQRRDQEAKAWPDPVDFLPWTAAGGDSGAGSPGVLLVSAFGEEERWFHGLEPEAGGQWVMTYRDPCEPYVEE